MGSLFFHLRTKLNKEDTCGCFSWISKCLPIKPHDTNIVSETQIKEEPAKEEKIKLPIMNLELLKSRAAGSLPEGLSSKELYEFLRKNPLIFEDNEKKLWIDDESLKSYLIISTKGLNITSDKDSKYWKWIPVEKSSFDEVARLDNVTWFEVRATIECGFLSPATKYRVSFRVKLDEWRFWRDPAKISLSTSWGFKHESARFLSDLHRPVGIQGLAEATFRIEEDGWVELDAGGFELPENVDEGMIFNEKVEVSFKQMGCPRRTGGFIDCVKIVPVKHYQQGREIIPHG